MVPANRGSAPPSTDLSELRRELREAAEPERVSVLQRFFKTGPGGYGAGDVFLGVRVPAVRVVVRHHAGLNLEDVTKLLRSTVHEERLAALIILVRRYGRADEQERQRIYDLYLGNTAYVNGWDLVDVSAPHIVGVHLLDRKEDEYRVLDRLASSPSVWERRIAIMATFAFVRAGECNETLRLARVLLEDEHDLIHKAVGWMLREVGKRDEVLLVGFLHQHAGEMPRTMLRYAVECLDVSLRTELVAGRATPAPPVGRDLGPLGINLAEFVRRYNDATRDQDGEIVPAVVTVYEDRSFDMVTKTPTTAYLLRRAAGLEKGSGTPGRDGASSITEEQLRKIAETKMPDLNASSVESAMKVVAGTARSMGIRVGR